MDNHHEVLTEALEADFRVEVCSRLPLVCIGDPDREPYEDLVALLDLSRDEAVVEPHGSEALAERLEAHGFEVTMRRECIVCGERYDAAPDEVYSYCRRCLELELLLWKRQTALPPKRS